jgi:hypothetical protein
VKHAASGPRFLLCNLAVIPGRLIEPSPESITANIVEKSTTLVALMSSVVFIDFHASGAAPE